MNWGHKIVLSYLAFIVFIAIIATKAMRENIDLVSKDYYQQEIDYQDQIGRINNAKENDAVMTFTYEGEKKSASVSFPEKHFTSATLVFYRPSDASKDFKVELNAKDNKTMFDVPLDKLSAGLWKAKIHWTDGVKEFYKEEDFVSVQ
jgi:hypothetical protein